MRTYSNDDGLSFREFARRGNTRTDSATVRVQLLPTDATTVRRGAGVAVVGRPGEFSWDAVTGRPNTCSISVVGGPVSRNQTVTWTIELSVPEAEVQGPRRRGEPPVQQECSRPFTFRVTEVPTGERDEDNNLIFRQSIRAIG
ncbi:hypothetical protein [Streptomyces tailanensis]|uniref:hypothetical protein n=1 Tax=Streptomyces tailanensis TaxID=2569858 RepID=UPI00155AEBBC|nr:hypothetical protein [Streptomyces tailanensis]